MGPHIANELVAEIHDRMPLILAPGDYNRWLSDEPDPHDLMKPFPAEPMRMWPISIGFIARPIGAAIFGHFGDRIGRKVRPKTWPTDREQLARIIGEWLQTEARFRA
jgi:MFS family permease